MESGVPEGLGAAGVGAGAPTAPPGAQQRGRLARSKAAPLPFKNVLSALWIGALFIPAGFWLRTRIDGVTVALGLLSGLLLVPALTPLLPTPLSHWVAAGLGLLGGAYLGRLTGAGPPRPA